MIDDIIIEIINIHLDFIDYFLQNKKFDNPNRRYILLKLLKFLVSQDELYDREYMNIRSPYICFINYNLIIVINQIIYLYYLIDIEEIYL